MATERALSRTVPIRQTRVSILRGSFCEGLKRIAPLVVLPASIVEPFSPWWGVPELSSENLFMGFYGDPAPTAFGRGSPPPAPTRTTSRPAKENRGTVSCRMKPFALGGRLAAEQRGLGPSILSSPNDSDEPIATAIRPAYGGSVLAWPFDIYRSDEPESMVSANDDLEHFLGVAKQLLISCIDLQVSKNQYSQIRIEARP
ncbi:hypothetical protein ETB97_012368 [Aspergillus alliaceus]|uniref:Uncharacterized protein n=1 Tax=Petromyces alliaceus TaxID=209559 RepID=A0A8H6A709_PETAA|nr:hypothetical protein ETB97_012368 [Aspergillus burnettii]